MKRIPPKAKKKSKTKKPAAIRSLRGKYKHLNLMTELMESRREERKWDYQMKAAQFCRHESRI